MSLQPPSTGGTGQPEAEPIYDQLRLGLAAIGAIVLAIGAGYVTAGHGMWDQRTRASSDWRARLNRWPAPLG